MPEVYLRVKCPDCGRVNNVTVNLEMTVPPKDVTTTVRCDASDGVIGFDGSGCNKTFVVKAKAEVHVSTHKIEGL